MRENRLRWFGYLRKDGAEAERESRYADVCTCRKKERKKKTE